MGKAAGAGHDLPGCPGDDQVGGGASMTYPVRMGHGPAAGGGKVPGRVSRAGNGGKAVPFGQPANIGGPDRAIPAPTACGGVGRAAIDCPGIRVGGPGAAKPHQARPPGRNRAGWKAPRTLIRPGSNGSWPSWNSPAGVRPWRRGRTMATGPALPVSRNRTFTARSGGNGRAATARQRA
jgi:hypothetical protein